MKRLLITIGLLGLVACPDSCEEADLTCPETCAVQCEASEAFEECHRACVWNQCTEKPDSVLDAGMVPDSGVSCFSDCLIANQGECAGIEPGWRDGCCEAWCRDRE